MNNETRKLLKKLHAEIEHLRTLAGEHKNNVEDVNSQLEGLKGEERDKFDNLSEGLQAAESGQAIERAAEALESAYDAVEEAVNSIDEAISSLDTALGSLDEACD